MKKTLNIATRSSQLALWQAEWVKAQINSHFPEISVKLIHIKTKGDKILDTPLAKIGGKGLFVKELEVALLENKADIAVHSLKDVPIELPEGLEISTYTKRENPYDAFVSNKFPSFQQLPQNSVVGTSSLRRIAQLKHFRPDIKFIDLRGNVNTRLKKLDNNEYDAIILASAGLIRLEMEKRINESLSVEVSLPAIGQGVVCIESRQNDSEILEILKPLNDKVTSLTSLTERALLTRLNGGCQVPLAGFAQISGDEISITGMIADIEGEKFIKISEKAQQSQGESLGKSLGEKLLKSGGREILTQIGIEVD